MVAVHHEKSAGVLAQGLALVSSTAINSVFGMAFWLLAARAYPAEAVGLASAVISGVGIVLGVGQLGLPLALARWLPIADNGARRLVRSSYVAVAVVSTFGAVAFVLVARRVESLAPVFASGWFTIWFLVSTAPYVVFAVQDFVLCGLRRARWAPVENLTSSMARLVLLVGLVPLGAAGLYLSTTLPAVIGAAVVTAALFRRVLPRPSDGESTFRWRTIAGAVGSDYAGSVAQTAAIRVLPLLIVAAVGPAPSAHFYAAWTLVYALDTALSNVMTALIVDGATDRAVLRQHLRTFLSVAVPALVAVCAACVGLAGPVLRLFSAEYAAADVALQVLTLSLLPRIVVLAASAAARHDGDASRLLRVQVVPAALTVVGAVVVADRGITAVAWAYTVAQVAAAGWAGGWLRGWLQQPSAVGAS